MSDALLKIDDAMDLDIETPIDVDEESDGAERKDQPPAFETLGQVQPTPLQSWLIKVMRRMSRYLSTIADNCIAAQQDSGRTGG